MGVDVCPLVWYHHRHGRALCHEGSSNIPVSYAATGLFLPRFRTSSEGDSQHYNDRRHFGPQSGKVGVLSRLGRT